MFPISRSCSGDGTQQCGIIELIDVRRGCQLIPKFGRTAINRQLTPNTVLDRYNEFYLNNRLDKASYRSVYWEVSDDDDDE